MGTVEHNVVGFSCIQRTGELNGIAAVIGIGKIVSAFQLGALGIDDPSPSGHHILIGLIAPGGRPGQHTVHPVAGAVTGVEIGHKRCFGNGGLIRKETGHTHPFFIAAGSSVGGFHPGVGNGIGIELPLDLVELGTVGGQAQGRVGTIQCQRQLQQAILIQQQMIPEIGIHTILLHIQSGKGIKGASADGVHGFYGLVDLAGIPVIVHKELVHGIVAGGILLQPQLVLVVDTIDIADGAGIDHGIVPADENIRAFAPHIVHHFVQQLGGLAAATVGLLIEEIAVEAVIFHHFQQLIRHREGAVLRLVAEGFHLRHLFRALTPREAQGRHHGNTVGMRRIGKFAGGTDDQALLRACPIHKRIGVLPIVEGPAEEILRTLGAGGIVLGIGQGAKHQLCLRIGPGIHHEAAHPVCQRNAGPIVAGVGIGFRGPLQQRVDIKGRAKGHQRFPICVGFVDHRRAVVAQCFRKCLDGGAGAHRRCHHRGQCACAEPFPCSDLHIPFSFRICICPL